MLRINFPDTFKLMLGNWAIKKIVIQENITFICTRIHIPQKLNI